MVEVSDMLRKSPVQREAMTSPVIPVVRRRRIMVGPLRRRGESVGARDTVTVCFGECFGRGCCLSKASKVGDN